MKFITDIIKGMVIGVANIIPGVSGGTMMVSMGIYPKLISAVNNLFKEFKKSFMTLLPIIIGMGLGIGIFSFIIPYCLTSFPLQTSLCFIGLILGGVPFIIAPAKESLTKENKKLSYPHVIAFVLLFALAVVMAFLNDSQTHASDLTLSFVVVIKMFFIGAIVAATMIVPGVSGSLVLMLLGFYTGIIETIRDFLHALLSFDVTTLMNTLGILIPFGIGVLVGIALVTKLINFLFERFPSITYSAILGLIVASPIGIIAKMEPAKINVLTVIVGVILLIAGCAFTYLFGKKTEN